MRSGLQHAIRGHVFMRGQPGFAEAAQVFNPRFDHLLPDAVARPVDGTDVRDAVRFCTEHHVPVRARSGGHSYAGYSTASRGTVLDLRRLDQITVDQESGTATVGAGLWALKGGGGGNFGVVTAFTFATHPMPSSSTYFEVRWPWSAADEAVEAWQTWAPQATDAVTSILHVESAGPGIFANGQYIGQSGQVPAVVKPLLEVTGARLAVNTERPYMQVQLLLAGCEGRTVAACHTVGAGPEGVMPRETFNAKSDYVARPLPAAGRAAMIAAAEHPGAGDLLCDAYGGAISRVAPTATAFVHRDPLFCIQYYGAGASAAWIEQAWRKLRPFVSGTAYQNYIDPALAGWQHAYYGQNLARLEATRARVDPDHIFDFAQAIGR
jgi:FAD/FMN-containing dehydrogenase